MSIQIALAQIDPVVGDLDGNRALILARVREARDAGADLVVLPELAVTGYPPEDLLLRPGFVRAAQRTLEEIAREVRGIVAFVGTPHLDEHLVVHQRESAPATPGHSAKDRPVRRS